MEESSHREPGSPALDEHDLYNVETALPDKVQSEATPRFLSRAYIFGPVKKSHGDLALLACCLVTGMVDSASFSNWGAFVGMQTGMTIGNTIALKINSVLTQLDRQHSHPRALDCRSPSKPLRLAHDHGIYRLVPVRMLVYIPHFEEIRLQ